MGIFPLETVSRLTPYVPGDDWEDFGLSIDVASDVILYKPEPWAGSDLPKVMEKVPRSFLAHRSPLRHTP